jgi:methane monooxygenase component C
MSFRIELLSRDGQSREFSCEADENLLNAAARHNLTLPSMCKAGSCGACRAECRSGEYQLGEHNPAALSADAATRREILLCSTTPTSDLSIQIDQDMQSLTAPPAPEYEAKVSAVEQLGGNVVRLEITVQGDSSGSANFLAGQYMELTIPDTNGQRRAYSIANTPNWDGLLEFYIRLQPNGLCANWLKNAKIGDILKIRGANGGFTLHENRLNPRWFVVGGTGLAPALSMLRWMAEMGAMQAARLYFGLNHESDLFAHAELKKLQSQLPSLQIEICVWKPETWQGFIGTPLDALARDLKDALNNPPDLYLCGPPGLVDGAEKLALSLGLSHAHIHSERFLPM